MKGIFACLTGLAALLVGGPGAATVAVLLSPLLSFAIWLLRPGVQPLPPSVER